MHDGFYIYIYKFFFKHVGAIISTFDFRLSGIVRPYFIEKRAPNPSLPYTPLQKRRHSTCIPRGFRGDVVLWRVGGDRGCPIASVLPGGAFFCPTPKFILDFVLRFLAMAMIEQAHHCSFGLTKTYR